MGYNSTFEYESSYTQDYEESVTSLVQGLQHYWRLEETSGLRADALGSANLTDNAGVGVGSGKHNKAAVFVQASNQFLSKSGVAISGDLSVAGWFRTNTAQIGTNVQGIVTVGNTWANDLVLWVGQNQNGIFCRVGDGAASQYAVSYLPVTTNWHMFVSWRNSSSHVGYISLDNTVSAATSPVSGEVVGNNIWVGRTANLNNFGWDGSLDEIGMWNRILTPAEQRKLWNHGKGRFLNAQAGAFR